MANVIVNEEEEFEKLGKPWLQLSDVQLIGASERYYKNRLPTPGLVLNVRHRKAIERHSKYTLFLGVVGAILTLVIAAAAAVQVWLAIRGA